MTGETMVKTADYLENGRYIVGGVAGILRALETSAENTELEPEALAVLADALNGALRELDGAMEGLRRIAAESSADVSEV